MRGVSSLFFLVLFASFLATTSLLLFSTSHLWSGSKRHLSTLSKEMDRDTCNRLVLLSFLSGRPLSFPSCGSEDTFVETAVVEGQLVVVRDAHRVYGR